MYINVNARSLQRVVEFFTILKPNLEPICEVVVDSTGTRLHSKNGETIRFSTLRCGYAGAETEALAEILEIIGFGTKDELFNLLRTHRVLTLVPAISGSGYVIQDSRPSNPLTTTHQSKLLQA